MSTTLAMSVENMGFLLDKMSRECAPLQYVRELTQNAIEAIRKAGRERGVINWGYDEQEFQRTGIKKLCVTDNGSGMSAEEMLRYLNHLSASGQTQAHDANFGIGAKISAYAKNQAGVTYLSFQGGLGNLVQIWKDPISGEYGLKAFDGQHVAQLVPEAAERYEEVVEFGSGTHVVLHGMTDNEDTFSASEGLKSVGRGPGQWVRKYLNTRYFRIPSNIEINCQTAGGGDEGSRYVTGQGPMLDGVALERGTVMLRNAIAYWWILPIMKKGTDLPKPIKLGLKPITRVDTLSPGYDVSCHMAAVFQDELHDTIRGASGRVMMQQFGVIFGYDRVVIYVQPTAGGVAPNAARTHLLINGESLPWVEWSEEFRSKLPKEIKSFMDQIQPSKHDSKSEDDRIKSVMDLFKVPRFKADTAGNKWIAKPDVGGRPSANGGSRPGDRDPGARGGRSANTAYAELINPNGTPGTEVSAAQELPHVVFVSAEEPEQLAALFGGGVSAGERPADMYPAYAGWFIAPNTINMNLDFGGLRVFLKKYLKGYPDNEATRAVVSKAVLSWWSQTMKEAVHGIRSLSHTRVWSKEEVSTALLADSGATILTAATMPRYLVDQAIKREIIGKMGGTGTAKDNE